MSFRPGEDEKGHTTDESLSARAQVLWGLQYDRDRHDRELLRHLLAEETAWRHNAPFQGLSDELRLAAYLVALDPQPGDTELMWTAKQANFDTWCGFDSRYLAIEGLGVALNIARELGDGSGGSLLSHLTRDDGTVWFDDDEVTAFVRSMGQEFPNDPELEWPATWVERARVLGDRGMAVTAVDSWAASDNPPTAHSLQYHYGWARHYGPAIQAQRSVVADSSDPGRLPGELARLVELQTLAEDFTAAARDLDLAIEALEALSAPSLDNAYRYQRRLVIEQGLLFAATDPDLGRARRTFDLVEPLGLHMALPLVVLEAGRDAARHLGDMERTEVWAERAREERERIDEVLGR